MPVVREFLDRNREIVKNNWDILPRSRKLALRLYYFSPFLFRVGARVLHFTGLQEKMGLRVK